jgi:hypothetical protein
MRSPIPSLLHVIRVNADHWYVPHEDFFHLQGLCLSSVSAPPLPKLMSDNSHAHWFQHLQVQLLSSFGRPAAQELHEVQISTQLEAFVSVSVSNHQPLVICQILLEMHTYVQKLFIPRSWFVTILMLCVTLIMIRHNTHACSSWWRY